MNKNGTFQIYFSHLDSPENFKGVNSLMRFGQIYRLKFYVADIAVHLNDLRFKYNVCLFEN